MLTERSVAAARTARGVDHEPDAQTLNGETARRKQRSDWMTDRPSVVNSAGLERRFADNTLETLTGRSRTSKHHVRDIAPTTSYNKTTPTAMHEHWAGAVNLNGIPTSDVITRPTPIPNTKPTQLHARTEAVGQEGKCTHPTPQ